MEVTRQIILEEMANYLDTYGHFQRFLEYIENKGFDLTEERFEQLIKQGETLPPR